MLNLTDVTNADKVLIDTWWNVNIAMRISAGKSIMVLIDTWWNVNVTYSRANKCNEIVLIDTWWNVNVVDIGTTNIIIGF